MRTEKVIVTSDGNDVDPRISRMESVLRTLRDFVDAQEATWSHDLYSLISFARDATIHFARLSAAQARERLAGEQLVITLQNTTEYLVAVNAFYTMVRIDAASNDLRPTPVLVPLSDGRPGDAKRMLARVQDIAKAPPTMQLHTIGFGSLQSFDHLQQLASISGGACWPAALSLASLRHAFSSVSSTITKVTTESSAFTFAPEGSGGSGSEPNEASGGALVMREACAFRDVRFEPPGQFKFGGKGFETVTCTRSWYTFDGTRFQEHSYDGQEGFTVQRRKAPFSKGWMRLVYCFQDSSVLGFSSARMVAKLSKFTDVFHNGNATVSAFAKSSTVAKFAARCFNRMLEDTAHTLPACPPRIVFVDTYLYHVLSPDPDSEFFIAERYLPGISLKYNSNAGICEPSRSFGGFC